MGGEGKAIDEVRRRLLRISVLMGGAVLGGHLPYSKPAVKSFFGVRSAYAQPSVVYTISCSMEISADQGAGTACQSAVITNSIAQVTPIPPVGTQLRCTPTTDDPANSTLPTTSSTTGGTDAAGQAAFAQLDLTGNVPNPPLAVGSVLTMTVSFVDAATFGAATCVTQITIVACP